MGVTVSKTDLAQTYIERLYSIAENQHSDPPPFWLPWHQKLLSRGELRSDPAHMDGFWVIPNMLMVGPQPNRKEAVTALVENHGVTTFVSVNHWKEYKMWYPLAAVEYNSSKQNLPSGKEDAFPPYWSVHSETRRQSCPSLEAFANEERDIHKELLSDPFNMRWIEDKDIEELRQIHVKGNTCEGPIVPYPGITEFHPQNTDPYVKDKKDTIDFHFPITLKDHGTTQLSYPICDGVCGDDISMIQLAEHIALRMLYAYPVARQNAQTNLLKSALDHTVPTWETRSKATSPANNDLEHEEDTQTHEVIYLHCHKGRGRAPTIAALVLVSLFGIQANEAIEYLQFCNWHRWSGSDCRVPQTDTQMETIQRLAPFVLKRSIPLGSSKLEQFRMDCHTMRRQEKDTKKRKTRNSMRTTQSAL